MGSHGEHSEEKAHRLTKTVNESDVDIAAFAASSESDEPLNPQVAVRLRRKIDRHLMPLMCLMYLMTFADKIVLGQSAVLGIITGAKLTQNQFNWLSTIFYLSYLAFQYPQNLALQRFPVGKWMSINIFIWAVALLSHAACKSFGALFAVRFILGMCEGAITPGFMIVTSMFYTRDEQTQRTGYWFLMNGFAIIFLGLVSFGLLHVKAQDFLPWQWIMIITGLITLLTSILFWFLFPDSPLAARFLTLEERVLAIQRIKVNQSGVENKHWKRDQFIETLRDPKTWVMALFAAIANIVNSLTNQRQLIVNQFGFSTRRTTLLGMVDGAVEIVTIWFGVSIVRFVGRGYAGVIAFIPATVGAILVNTLPSSNKIGLLFSYWVSIFAITPFVIFLGWVSSITAGHTKKTTTNAVVLCAYAIGNAAGPFMWKQQYQPRNHIPWAIITACFVVSAALLLVLRFMLASENGRRDAERRDEKYDEVYVIQSKDSATVRKRVDRAFLDLTDKQNRDFQYVL